MPGTNQPMGRRTNPSGGGVTSHFGRLDMALQRLSLIAHMPQNGHIRSSSIGGPMTNHPVDGDALLTPAEVAALFRVDPKTVTRWARAGKLTSLRTLDRKSTR